jgi:anhydro-N-acetylmuramic acid kinase
MKTAQKVIGVMSGTSLDGVDLAFCTFVLEGEKYSFSIDACETVPYDENWKTRLTLLPSQDALAFAQTHAEYGHYIGKLLKSFVTRNHIKPDFIASHGHTIFHQPDKGFTSQIGDGAAMAAECGFPVVCDFRTSDVACGGQGAPLVPIGDRLLFSDYDYCLNLGGFGNISFEHNGQRIAFDTCPVNIVLNFLAGKAGLHFDKDGRLATSGKVVPVLLEKLNSLPFYHRKPPKSLGREWVEAEFLPLLPVDHTRLNDILATVTEHIAIQIADCVPVSAKNIFVTGGGAFNKYLISRIKTYAKADLIIPAENIINYKEALIFAFLGLLRVEEKPNCLPSVTGARKSATGGAIYLP